MCRVETAGVSDVLGISGVRNVWMLYDKYIEKYGRHRDSEASGSCKGLPVQRIDIQTQCGFNWFRMLDDRGLKVYRLKKLKDINTEVVIILLNEEGAEYSESGILDSDKCSSDKCSSDKCSEISEILMLSSELNKLMRKE